MDQDAAGSQAWFDEVLVRSGIDVTSMVRVDSPRRPAVQRSNPWEETDEIEAAAQVLRAVRVPGSETGHMIFVTDVEEDPVARVQAAVQIARAAVGQGVDVLMVDADIRQVGLSRWLPDRDLDAEGLVDILQYGASVAVARRPSVVDGIDVLGVGSYRPDVSGVFESDDLRRLCAQLRSSAGLIVLVGAARLTEAHFHPLIGEVDHVAVSMHLDRGLADPLGEFLEYVVGLKLPVAGMFLWAGPDDAEQFVDDALLERSRVLPRAVVDSPFPGRGVSAPDPDPPSDPPGVEAGPGSPDEQPVTAPISSVEDAPAVKPGSVVERAAADSGPKSVRIKTERVRPGSRRRSGGSSGIIRGAMVAVGLVIVAFAVWWGLTLKSAGPKRPRVQPPARPAVVAQTSESEGLDVMPDPASSLPTEAAGSIPVENDPTDIATDRNAGKEVETSRQVDGLLAAPVESGPVMTEQMPEPEEPAPVADPFDAGLRRRSGSGWALHLYSFPDSMEAVVDSRGLRSDGYAVAVRGANIKGRRWYRVLVGSFDTRAEASRFRSRAQEEFGVDWVGVVKK